jgi:hypothetical protein
MKSPKWLGMGFVVAAVALMACARAAPTTEDDEDLGGLTVDASADTSKPPTPKDAASQPDSATPPTDAAVPVDASRDATPPPPPPPPPPPDSSTGLVQCTSPLDIAKGVAQLGNGDTPPCDATCRGCCNPLPAFCVKPLF